MPPEPLDRALALRPSEPPPFGTHGLVEPYASLAGASLLVHHYSCGLNSWEGSGAWAQLSVDGCRPPNEAWLALKNAEHKNLWLAASNTEPSFLLLTLHPDVDAMSALLHDKGMLDPFMSYWHWASARSQPFYQQREQNTAAWHMRRPLYVDVGANLGWFGLLAISLGFRSHFVGHLVARAIRLSLRINGWQPFGRLFNALPVGAVPPRTHEGGLVHIDDMPVSLEALLEDESAIALMRISLEPDEETGVILAAQALLSTRRVHRIVMDLHAGDRVLETMQLLAELGYELYQIVDDREQQWRVWERGGFAHVNSWAGDDADVGGGTRPLGDLVEFARELMRYAPHTREILCMLPEHLAGVPYGEEERFEGYVPELEAEPHTVPYLARHPRVAIEYY